MAFSAARTLFTSRTTLLMLMLLLPLLSVVGHECNDESELAEDFGFLSTMQHHSRSGAVDLPGGPCCSASLRFFLVPGGTGVRPEGSMRSVWCAKTLP